MAEQTLSARRRVVTLVAMCVAQGMILLDNTIVNVALPSIQRELDVDPGNLIWVVNADVLGVRESRNPHARRLDLGGAVLVATGLCVLTLAIVESEHIGWTSPTMIALLATAVCCWFRS